jgi:hypothetical protein
MIIDLCAGLYRPQTVLSLQNGHNLDAATTRWTFVVSALLGTWGSAAGRPVGVATLHDLRCAVLARPRPRRAHGRDMPDMSSIKLLRQVLLVASPTRLAPVSDYITTPRDKDGVSAAMIEFWSRKTSWMISVDAVFRDQNSIIASVDPVQRLGVFGMR